VARPRWSYDDFNEGASHMVKDDLLSTEDLITELFVRVDEKMSEVHKDPRCKLWPGEIVTVGLLFSIKGVGCRAFYRWLSRDWRKLFPCLPERTRLFRLLTAHRD
jgi:hypothetical protein